MATRKLLFRDVRITHIQNHIHEKLQPGFYGATWKPLLRDVKVALCFHKAMSLNSTGAIEAFPVASGSGGNDGKEDVEGNDGQNDAGDDGQNDAGGSGSDAAGSENGDGEELGEEEEVQKAEGKLGKEEEVQKAEEELGEEEPVEEEGGEMAEERGKAEAVGDEKPEDAEGTYLFLIEHAHVCIHTQTQSNARGC